MFTVRLQGGVWMLIEKTGFVARVREMSKPYTLKPKPVFD